MDFRITQRSDNIWKVIIIQLDKGNCEYISKKGNHNMKQAALYLHTLMHL